MKGFMIAAPQSRSGKTTVTLGLLRALARRGEDIAPAKSGPDFIDPAFHEVASGAPCINLDAWAMRPETVKALAAGTAAGGKTLVVEAAMGLFDGAADGSGSAADLAAMLDLPVILVLDCARQSQSVAALVQGFRDYRADINVAGLILNRVGSVRHEAMLRAVLQTVGIPVIGALYRSERLALPERHLGLVQAREHGDLGQFVAHAGDLIAETVDFEALARIAASTVGFATAGLVRGLEPLGQKIAIARDDAFAFSYPHILKGWRNSGAGLSFFSPLSDEAPVTDSDAVFLPGGYPELHAGKLANAGHCRNGLLALAAGGAVIYGECGGFMAMGEGLTDADGRTHAMFGLLPLETSFAERKRHLGYRKLIALEGAPFAGEFRGHEFHYATIVREGEADRLFATSDATDVDLGEAGLRRGMVCGSFMHLIDRAVGDA